MRQCKTESRVRVRWDRRVCWMALGIGILSVFIAATAFAQDGNHPQIMMAMDCGDPSMPTIFSVTTSCPALPTFSQRRLFGTGRDLTNSIAIGDMNSDGFLDIIEGNKPEGNRGQSAVYLNDGSGNFDWEGSEVLFGSNSDNILSVAVGDVDGDGILDIVAGRENSGALVFFNRNGAFYQDDIDCNKPELVCLTSSTDSAHAVALGDMDGTGSLDIVLGGDSSVVIYFNDGGGRFSHSQELILEDADHVVNTRALAVADLDSRNGLDIVVGALKHPGHVFYNDGSGSFPKEFIWTFGDTTNKTTGLAVADMDGQFGLDIVVSDDSDLGGALYLNDGEGRFDKEENRYRTLTGSTSVAVGDLDNNGFADLVFGDSMKAGVAMLFRGSESITLPTLASFGARQQAVTSIAIADLNNDGSLDIVMGNEIPFAEDDVSGKSQNAIYLSDGQSLLRDALSENGFDKGKDLVIADMNADYAPDVVVSLSTGGIAVYENDAQGQLRRNDIESVDEAREVAVGDLDGRNGLDIVATVPGKGVVVHYQNENGLFETNDVLEFELPIVTAAIGDLDGDTDIDIVAAGTELFVLVNNGEGNFTERRIDGEKYTGANRLLLGDFDHNGALDLLVTDYRSSSALYFNNGSGAFPQELVQPLPQSPDRIQSAVVGDLNGDGFLDIVLGAFLGPETVLLNDTTGKFISDASYELGTYDDNTYGLALGDINMDGHLDLAVFDPKQPVVAYINDGTGGFANDRTWTFSNGLDASKGSIELGDINGDGQADLIVVADGNNANVESKVFFTPRLDNGRLINDPPVVRIHDPGLPSNASGYSSPQILDSNVITVSYTLFDNDGDPVQFVRACYSLDGSGNWQPAVEFGHPPFASTEIVRPANGCPYVPSIQPIQFAVKEASAAGVEHTFQWDTWASGLFGQSDNVVFRLEAYPGQGEIRNGVPGPFQRPFVSTQTPPFRVRGNQVRVVNTIESDGGLSDAVVYRLPAGGKERGAEPLGGLDHPFRTTSNGFLQGRAEMTIDPDPEKSDHLVALWPASEVTGNVPSKDYISQDTFPITVTANSTMTLGLNVTDARRIADIGVWVDVAQPVTETIPVTLVAPRHNPTEITEVDKELPFAHKNVFFVDTAADVQVDCSTQGETCQRYVQGLASLHGLVADGVWTLEIVNPSGKPLQLEDWGLTLQLSPLNFTNAEPRATGLETDPVTGGVQTLTVTTKNPLLLFDLDVALEWDASNDEHYQAQLSADLRRASELLYDWTNGQVALGNVRVYHDARRNILPDGTNAWNNAHIRIYASNRLRPNADQGGIISHAFSETVTLTLNTTVPVTTSRVITYLPGQVRMGVTWNRYSDATAGNLGDDWPAALAHELGHYLLFLDDNYLGLQDNLIVPLRDEECPSAMNNPYSNNYSEFHPKQGWDEKCGRTLSEQNTERSDWETIETFYPWLIAPSEPFTEVMSGPSLLPLAVTQISFQAPGPASDRLAWLVNVSGLPDASRETIIQSLCEPGKSAFSSRRNPGSVFNLPLEFGCPGSLITSTLPLQVPIFYLKRDPEDNRAKEDATYRASDQARAFLFQGGETLAVVDLGQPGKDQILARGARPLDRLCVYDAPQELVGCQDIEPGNDQITMYPAAPSWEPQLIITPETTRTLQISLTLPLTDVNRDLLLKARLYPMDGPSSQPITMTSIVTDTQVVYRASISMEEPVLEGYVWVGNVQNSKLADTQQAITEFAIGGNPVRIRAMRAPGDRRNVRIRAMRVRIRAMRAPAASTDGQVLVYPGESLSNLNEEWSFILQPATRLPKLLPWATPVGRAYWLAASSNITHTSLAESSITFEYLRSDVPPGEEAFVRMYVWDEAAQQWRMLDEQESHPEHMLISARLEGPGLYALFSHYEIPLQTGWNLIGYPVQTRGVSTAERTVGDVLQSIAGKYDIVYGYDPCDAVDPWKIYSPGMDGFINDLNMLDFGRGYWINVTSGQPETLYLRGAPAVEDTPGQGTSATTCIGSQYGAPIPAPPTTYYGQIITNAEIFSVADLPVSAVVDGIVCGTGLTRTHNDMVVYDVTVFAADSGNGFACGRAGKEIKFRMNDQEIVSAPWIENGVQQLDFSLPAGFSGETALVPSCMGLLPNGDFEGGLSWDVSSTDDVTLDSGQGYGASQGLRMSPAPKSNVFIQQELTLPADATQLRVRFVFKRSEETTYGPNLQLLVNGQTVWNQRTDNSQWQGANVDLSAYRGSDVILRLEAANWQPHRTIAAVVDDLNVLSCR